MLHAVRYDVDNTGLTNQYILTGSATPGKTQPSHSGAGRIARITMRPMTLFESGESTGTVSLQKLFKQDFTFKGSSSLTLTDIAHLCVRGGWPTNVLRNPKNPGKLARDYLNTIIADESLKKSPEDISFSATKMHIVLRSLARNIATPVTFQTIIADSQKSTDPITDKTLSNYLNILQQIHILDDIPPWSPSLRSKTTVRSAPKRNFADPSLVAATLLATADDLRSDHHTFGLVFESLALRDLKVYTESLDGELFYYRDSDGRESDAIIHLPNGQWAAIEIKLGTDQSSITAAINSLQKFQNQIDTDTMRSPSFLMVLTAATNYPYRDPSGILVIPIGCLRN